MKILSIETSCDETAVSIIEAKGTYRSPSFNVLGSVVHSQASLHAEWMGVVPTLAKREHSINLVPVLMQALKEASMYKVKEPQLRVSQPLAEKIAKIFDKENQLAEFFWQEIPKIKTPEVDAIAVTYGPGLEPALWTGINFAKALSLIWKKEIIPINHMEGHILSVLLPVTKITMPISKKEADQPKIILPALALLISGGHTELVLIKDWLKYQVIGHTRDDAVGEAFDKVARMLGLPYPGGPEISRLAAQYEENIKETKRTIALPRPMIFSKDFDFSFSGLKTAVLYTIKKLPELTDEIKKEIAYEFEQAVVEILAKKTKRAIEEYEPKTVIIGGGVIANKKIRETFQKFIGEYLKTKLLIPHLKYSTDNATMIGISGYFRWLDQSPSPADPSRKRKRISRNFKATGNLVLK
ncbi:MAG: tRNA (adenosine(37)-N6)-threonylcarbamoyltransferase complex transferase subunit TsaD [Patescibacteria group bacterium]